MTVIGAMRPIGDDRGVSELAGAVLVFAAIVITLSAYQVTVVPTQNYQAEFDHNLRVHADMQELRQAMLNAPARSGSESVLVELGVRYPTRQLLVNPAPPAGTLETDDDPAAVPNITVSNATATGEVGDFWTGDPREYSTVTVTYQPGYNRYTDAPDTSYEHPVLYNRFNATELPLTGQTIVDGRRISMVAVSGTLSENSIGTVSVDVRSVSPGQRTVTVTDSGGNVTVSVPTRLALSTWRELLDGEFVANGTGGHVVGLTLTDVAGMEYDRLTIELEAGETYELRLANVVVGDATETADLGYVVPVTRTPTTMTTDGEQLLLVEVRDRFNNPISGADVTFVADNGTFSNGSNTTVITTDVDGQADAVLSASAEGEATVTAGIDANDDGSLEDEPADRVVTFTVDIESS